MAYSDRPRSEKWEKKFRDNRARDQRVTEQLLQEGWRVAVIWECATRNQEVFDSLIRQLDQWIRAGDGQYFESKYRKT
jgi:DNA mismatch endonuclease (patch repair protein)